MAPHDPNTPNNPPGPPGSASPEQPALQPGVQPLRTADGMVACPKCGSMSIARPGFTWWGGLLGPKLLSHVQCNSCGNRYNGKTGRPNTFNIAMYSVVVGLIVFGLVMAVLS